MSDVAARVAKMTEMRSGVLTSDPLPWILVQS
jgi:hypothetical protein